MLKSFLAALALAAAASPAFADVKASAPDALTIQFKGVMPLDKAAAYARSLAVGKWWSDQHTYSGKAANMTVEPKAGGCWCEKWAGGEVEHGRVVAMMKNQMVRYSAALGPLQATGVNAMLTITLADGASPNQTAVTMDYVVVGSSLSGLDKMSTPVDGVLKEQFDKFVLGR